MPHLDPAVQFFDSTAQAYESKHYGNARSLMTVRLERVLQLVDGLDLPPGTPVLDAGCGPGYLLAALAQRGFSVSGLDASKAMLDRARVQVDRSGSPLPAVLEQGSIEGLPYRDRSFDLVCSTGVIEYLPDDAKALQEMFRVLKPGGHLILPVTNRWSPINWLDFVIEFLKRRDSLRQAFNVVWQELGRAPVMPRHFAVRRHSPPAFRASLVSAGFRLEDAAYFHFLPWPHPFDVLLPGPSAWLGNQLERFGRSWIGPIAEGYLILAVKPSRSA